MVIRENHISQLPGFPTTMTLIDASLNNIGSKGIHHEAFKVCTTRMINRTHTADCYHCCLISSVLPELTHNKCNSFTKNLIVRHQDMTSLLYLYLTDNRLDYIPVPLPDSLRSLHLQVRLVSHRITATRWPTLEITFATALQKSAHYFSDNVAT